MGLFDDDAFEDVFEDDMEAFEEMQLLAGSRKEAKNLTGDDSLYIGDETSQRKKSFLGQLADMLSK